MINEYRIELNGCIIDKPHLLALIELVNKNFGRFRLSISFEDNTSIRDLSIDDFSNYDFSNKVITSIELKAYQYDSANKIDNDFSLAHYYSDNSYSLSFHSADYSFYSLVKNLIEDWIKNVTVKSRIRTLKLLKYPPIISLIVSLFLSIFVSIGNVRLFNITSVWISMVLSIFSGAVLFFVCLVIFDTIKETFPSTEIEIGFNKQKQLRKRYYFLLTVFIIPLIYMIIGIIVPMFINK